MPGQAVNLRFRDGSIYQSQATDANGEVQFNEVFPFFNWLAAEVDFARFKATGATIVVDAGGPVPAHNGWTTPSWNKLNPQPQSENGGLPYRTETGPVLVQAFQGFLGQTNVIEWGKNNYATGENGGISGVVLYATTRAEEDPRFAAAENWEPGIPRVQVNLYRDCNADGIIDKADCTATSGLNTAASVVLADTDNWPFGNFPGAEDIDRNSNAVFDQGDAYDVATTDSWDDNQPSGCQGTPFVSNGHTTDCYDGLRNFNQVRPGVFDGGYAFGGGAGKPELPPGKYIVESKTPPGYLTVKEEDKNVDFGDTYQPGTLALPPACVGDLHAVPDELTLFPGVASAYARQQRPLCDRKSVDVAQGKNAAADFFMFTEVPAASHIVGMILNDVANEFDPNAPTFGEKQAPAWVPVSIRDWSGREISRVYSDQWGTFNALVPSTYSMNIPMPSGVSPNMLTTCMNDPGPIPDGSGNMVIDPYFDRQFSQFCYTFQYLPGKTTYLDTPVLPVAAFAGPGQFPLDCEFSDGTPVVYTVNGRATSNTGGGYVTQNGPYVPQRTVDQTQLPTLTIVSAGTVEVPNPSYDGTANTPRMIPRNFGFGNGGTVTVGGAAVTVTSWSNGLIEANVPFGTPTGELVVTRSDTGKASLLGVTVTVGGKPPTLVQPGGSIQAAINAALPGDLIMIAPGRYDELVIMDKKVKLQGWGALATNINAAKVPAEKLAKWRSDIALKYANGGATRTFDLVPGQTVGFNAPDNEPGLFNTEEGPGIIVVAKIGEFISTNSARIDGLSISGGDSGGGIFVNGHAKYLEISNNKIFSNYGTYGGGIRIGHPNVDNNGSDNDFIRIHNNLIAQNGAAGGVGGGVSIYAGAQVYNVSSNHICGNFSAGHGGGIGHQGSSNRGVIANNTVIFNQSFNQGLNVSGGGIFVGGQAPIVAGTLSPGSGNVTVSGNLVQGNQAGAGDGGGIAAQFVNGTDIVPAPNNESTWYRLVLENNVVVNNLAGMAGGGISLQDVALSTIVNNTVADNQSTATAGAAFAPGSPNLSTFTAPIVPGTLSPGSGNVTVSGNLVQGNQAGAGDGGGIAAQFVNGTDIVPAPNNESTWYRLVLENNVVVNNLAGMAGGGISLQDVALSTIVNNTVADNQSTATAGAAFAPGSPNLSTAQPAGIVSRAHSTLLANTIGNGPRVSPYKRYANPMLVNNIVWHNRSYFWSIDNSTLPATFGLHANAANPNWDLAVQGTAVPSLLDPRFSDLSDATGYHASNRALDPMFVTESLIGPRGETIQQPEFTTGITTAPAFDEGGNWIDVRFGIGTLSAPSLLSPAGNFHLQAGSPVINQGTRIVNVTPVADIDGQARSNPPDIGADEQQ